jgi:V8-like Glu-specific endopeptidase
MRVLNPRINRAVSAYAYGAAILGASFIQAACYKASPNGGDDSQAKIVGGALETGKSEVVRLLLGNDPLRICTGVIISDSTVLLAGHCIDAKAKEQAGVTVEGLGVMSKNIFSYKQVMGATQIDDTIAASDLAAVVYPKGTFKAPYAALAETSAAKNDVVTLVGYGAASFTDIAANAPLGVKRSGKNRLTQAKDGVYYLSADIKAKDLVQNAVAAPGDSGGPVYNESGKLIGIIVGLDFTDQSGKVLPIVEDANKKLVLPLDRAANARNIMVDLSSLQSKVILEAAAANNQLMVDQTPVAPAVNATKYLAICSGSGGSNPLSGLLGNNENGGGPLGGLLGPLLRLFSNRGNNGTTPVTSSTTGDQGVGD